MRETRFGLAVCVCVVALIGACSDGGGGGGGSLASLGVDDGASKGASKSVMVTGQEDVRIALKTGALMDVPAGAVSKNVELTMERPADTKAVQLVERFKQMQDRIVSAPYVLKPHGTKFQQEVTLTLPLAKEGKREVSVAWLEDENDTEWKFLGKAKTDAAGKKAEVKIKHFSVVVIVEDASDLEPVEDVEQPVADAGGSVVDAGADAGDDEARDAGARLEDAGASVLDASARQDAGAELDASDPAPDAGVDLDATPAKDSGGSLSRDAETVVDAGAADATDDGPFVPPADAGDADASDADASDADAGDAAGPPPTAQYSDLDNCGFVVSSGNFSVGGGSFGSPFDGTWQMCMHQCYATDGDCIDNQAYRCSSGAELSAALQACQSACQEVSTQCPNDADAGMQQCNGVIDCPFGVDEQGCDPMLFFTCQGAERVAMYHLCDGLSQCSGGQDEANCFFCDDDTKHLAPYRVCDGVLDCNDLTDEQAGCAAIQCAPID